ncbi:MAG: ABC transporter ATP-binding protein [Actinomycetota bacterium]
MQLDSVVMAFGGLVAVAGVSFGVDHGRRLALLGPNGAGKTTVFNVLAGDLIPTAGRVHIDGADCTALPSRARPGLGMARTYQRTRLFAGLTVSDNLYLSVTGKEGTAFRPWRTAEDRRRRDRVAEVAERVWIADRLDTRVEDLSHGQRRQVEIGMALATDPTILLLDEPASGLSRGERERLTELLLGLERSITLLIIEHDMDVALEVADDVVVMSDGEVVATGTPSEITANEVVQQIYLGRGADVATTGDTDETTAEATTADRAIADGAEGADA